jgi:hypothetical protein
VHFWNQATDGHAVHIITSLEWPVELCFFIWEIRRGKCGAGGVQREHELLTELPVFIHPREPSRIPYCGFAD